MNQQRTSKIKQERVVPTGHPKTNLNSSLLLKVFFFRKQIFGKYISVLLYLTVCSASIREELSFVSVTNVATLI
jgi:hypothetical protein